MTARAPAVLKIRKRWVTELGTYVLDLSTGMKVTLKFNQTESEIKNLNESTHFIASVFLSSKVVENYIRPPNLDKINYISYF